MSTHILATTVHPEQTLITSAGDHIKGRPRPRLCSLVERRDLIIDYACRYSVT